MDVVPKDPALTQYITEAEFHDMASTFSALAESGKSLVRLPKKDFDRRKVVAAFDEAFDLIGGVPRLAIWAHNNPTEFYKLYGKLIPSSAHMDIVGQVEHIIRPALPPSALDGEFTSHDGDRSPVSATTSVPAVPSPGDPVRGDGGASPGGEDGRVRK